jgi:hypothetical protein
MSSGALQFADDWRSVVEAMARSAERYLYIARLPVVDQATSYRILQRAHAYGYATEYASWVLNRHELMDAVRAGGLELERTFLGGDPTQRIRGAPEPATYLGFLFRPSADHG